MWKLHRKLNFPNIFRLAAIYTRPLSFCPTNLDLSLFIMKKNGPCSALVFWNQTTQYHAVKRDLYSNMRFFKKKKNSKFL